MKNKKIIPLTIAIVAVALMGMLGLSKFFETSWQRENIVDNNLNAEIDKYTEKGSFDYPYTLKKHSLYEDEIENIISYQQAANIAGEAILYLSGVTEHQKIPADLCLEQTRRVIVNNTKDFDETGVIIKERYDYPVYRYSSRTDVDLTDENCPKYILADCTISAETGDIVGITIEDYRKYGQDYLKIREEFMPNVGSERTLTQDETDKNLDYVKQITDVLKWNFEPVVYNMKETVTPYGLAYNIEVLMNNGEAYFFLICSEDGNIEKDSLIAISRYNYTPENFTYID